MIFGPRIEEPTVSVLPPLGVDEDKWKRYLKKEKARANYWRFYSLVPEVPDETRIVLHMRPQPNTRTMRGIRDLVQVLVHEYSHNVLDRIAEQAASTCFDKLTDNFTLTKRDHNSHTITVFLKP